MFCVYERYDKITIRPTLFPDNTQLRILHIHFSFKGFADVPML